MHAVGHKYLGANQNYSEEYTVTFPAGISQLGQSSSHSRGLFSALQQILQNTETKLARPRCHHGKFCITILKQKNFVVENTVMR